MKLAIMQPYIFPYLGYYQLVNAVDTFVFFDDVNFINKGWINRNQLLHQNQPLKFTIPLIGASQNKMINEIELSEFSKWRVSFLKSVEYNYKKAPYFSFVFNWLNEFFFAKNYLFINELASESIKAVSGLLKVSTEFKNSGSLQYKNEYMLNGEQKIISICKLLEADTYINPKNGINLYNSLNFAAEQVQLNFIKMDEIRYDQFNKEQFVPNLSIIDVLMFNSVEETGRLINRFSLN